MAKTLHIVVLAILMVSQWYFVACFQNICSDLCHHKSSCVLSTIRRTIRAPESYHQQAPNFKRKVTLNLKKALEDDVTNSSDEQPSLTQIEGDETNGSIPAWLAYTLLNAVAIIWGTQHAVIKSVVEGGGYDPALVNFVRFAIAGTILSPWTPGLQEALFKNNAQEVDQRGTVQEQWQAGIELGLWMFLGYGFQAIGLETTTASRSAFLLYLNVKFVPFFAWILLGRQIPKETWISAFTAFAGTALLCGDGGAPPAAGDAWSAAAAAASAMFILRLERYAGAVGALQLNAANLVAVTALCAGWAVGAGALEAAAAARDPGAGAAAAAAAAGAAAAAAALPGRCAALAADPAALGPVLYLGAVTTALTNLIQTLGQKSVPAEKAAIIYAADPVYGAFFAWLLLGETLGPQGWVGAILILGAAVYNNQSFSEIFGGEMS